MEFLLKIKKRKVRDSLTQIANLEHTDIENIALKAVEQYVKNYEMGKIFDIKFKYAEPEEFISKYSFEIDNKNKMNNITPYNDIDDSSDFIDNMRNNTL